VQPDDSAIKEQSDQGVALKLTPKDEDGGNVQQRELLHALRAMRAGDFTVRLPADLLGLPGKIAETFNDIVEANQRMAEQLEDVGQQGWTAPMLLSESDAESGQYWPADGG